MVFICKDGHVAPLALLYKGPYKVLSRSLKTFQLQVGKRVQVVSVQRLKPAFTAGDEASIAPPCRGRPPRQPQRTFPTPHSVLSIERLLEPGYLKKGGVQFVDLLFTSK